MIWSGTLIYWANPVYKFELGNEVLFKFYPPAFFKALNIPHRLAEGMAYHFSFMWLFFLNGLLYCSYMMFSGQWRHLLPGKRSPLNALKVVLYDLRIIRTKPSQGKYNDAQRIAYSGIIFLGFLEILSGLAIFKPVVFTPLTTLLGGYESARRIHFVITILFLVFFLVHVLQVIFAGWNNFRAMITGWEIRTKDPNENKDEPKTT